MTTVPTANAAPELSPEDRLEADALGRLLAGPPGRLLVEALDLQDEAEIYAEQGRAAEHSAALERAAALEAAAAADLVFQQVDAASIDAFEVYVIVTLDATLRARYPQGLVWVGNVGRGDRVIPAALAVRRQALEDFRSELADSEDDDSETPCRVCQRTEADEWFETDLCAVCHDKAEAAKAAAEMAEPTAPNGVPAAEKPTD